MSAPNRMARWAAGLLALAAAAGTAACAGPPSKGEVRSAPLNQSRNNVVILAREPTPGMTPEQLVNSFLQALTGDQQDPTFSVAQEFLTPEARNQMVPPGSTRGWVTTTKIVNYQGAVPDPPPDPDHGVHPAAAATATPAVGAEQTVSVTGTQYAQIDPFGFFKYQTGSVTQTFTVKYFGATTGWRIESAPDSRMISADAFKRAYQTYQSALPVYLPTHDQTAEQMDQVYLTQASGKVDYTYDALARAVLQGRYPGQNSLLSLASPVTLDPDGVATVTLAVPHGGMPDITDVQRALYLTFQNASETQQLLSATPLTQLRVTYAGCGSTCKPETVVQAQTPSPTVYWLCPEGQNGAVASIVYRTLSPASNATAACPTNGAKPQSVVAMAGVNPQKNSPIAVKVAPDSSDIKDPKATTDVAVVETNGDVVVLDDKTTDQRVWYDAVDPAKVTDLEWDPLDGSLWVVDDDNLYRVQAPGDSPQPVLVPGQHVVRFKPSPDGLRAVVVSGQNAPNPAAASSPQPAMMVTIDRSADLPSLDNATEFQLLQGSSQTGDLPGDSDALQTVFDASWADGRTVVLLGVQTNSSTQKLYKVYLDGSQDSTILDPEDAQPVTQRVGAAIGNNNNGRGSAMWTFSDAPGPTDPNSWYSYFKRSGGSDSFQELGWSPVTATQLPS
ncbi:hypothetical protein KGQ20_16275 [Catenulispora sp. NF23]|uniref:Lipoprotein LpqB N-terminal domain-containing protein n=1 Tax=Catenulispora pinistramenti TaxID=2705254 RepID=A0ABS5L0P8_9ACTN|nr:hypothetical protein [Catenulispora pinistramenti]MBS2534327.1 hypothetical protein [Catenulispora pinistramenti]MBS2551744.1 hypothetical protein [Catenulispora pinistramenti]